MSKILLLEDVRSVRQALRFELEDEGHDVIDVDSFPEAISASKAFKCDLIISDLFLKEGNGMQLLKQTRKTPFIGITAFPDAKLSVKAKTILKDRLLKKPFPISDLINKVNEVLGNNHLDIA